MSPLCATYVWSADCSNRTKFLSLSTLSLCRVNSSLRKTPPTGSISALSTSVRTVITGRVVELGAAILAGGAPGFACVVAPGGSVGDGVAVTACCAVSCGAAGCGLRSFTHASYSRKTETRKIIAANNRKLSMEDVFYSGCRIGTARVPRVATQQTPAGEPASAQDAVGLDRGFRVFRTSRVEAAVTAYPRAQQVLVELNQPYQGGAHQRTPLKKLCNSPRAW